MRVGRLEEHEVERPLSDVLDDGEEARVDSPLEHRLQKREEADDDERLGERPPGDAFAPAVDDEQRDERRRHPEDLDGTVDHEVGAVLRRFEERRAELRAQDAGVRSHATTPPRRPRARSS